nr:MAG TPA: hypothetical protein [Caudoviricetes sp.]DAZ66194.1 MAG TPA: hypothetical protein [Caudoviricetes sp.]
MEVKIRGNFEVKTTNKLDIVHYLAFIVLQNMYIWQDREVVFFLVSLYKTYGAS